jgi:hypothetical protein
MGAAKSCRHFGHLGNGSFARHIGIKSAAILPKNLLSPFRVGRLRPASQGELRGAS